MDFNSGQPWSEEDLQDLRKAIVLGDMTIRELADYFYRDVDEVRDKIEDLERRRSELPP